MIFNKFKKLTILFIFSLSLSLPSNTQAIFDTLTHIKSYVQTKPEFPPIDNNNLFSPNYQSFLEQQNPSYIQKLLTRFHIISKPLWSINDFQLLLTKYIQEHKNNVDQNSRHICKINTQNNDKIFVWGNLQGALHSFTRDLLELQKNHIIDEQLRITKAHYYFVFNGNMINSSPYSLEILTIIIRLLKQNPDQVFYIKGDEEDEGHWRDFTLKQELKIRARSISQEKIPLETLIDQFYTTLPLALYLIPENITAAKIKKHKITRISFFGIEKKELDEKKFTGFLLSKNSKKTSCFSLEKTLPSPTPIQIAAIIKGKEHIINNFIPQTLQLLPSTYGITTWMILSCPIEPYQINYDFYYDGFAQIAITSDIETWSIQAYNQDVRTKNGFNYTEKFFLTSGFPYIPAEKRAKQKIIHIGTTLDLSKQARIEGESILQALHMRLKIEQEKPELKNISLQLKSLDDEYNPTIARKNAHILLNDYNIDIFLSPVGSPTIQSFLDLVKQQKIAIIFSTSGAPIFRNKDLKNIINFRPSYVSEGAILTSYAVEHLQAHNFVFFYQNDSFGQGPLEGARKKLKEAGIKKWTELPYNRNDISFTSQAMKIREVNPDVIGLFCTPIAAIELINQVGIENIATTKFLGISDMAEKSFKEYIKDKGLTCTIVMIVPDPLKSDLEIIKEFRENAKKYYVPISTSSLEGYINASLFIELAKHIKGSITKESLIKSAQENMKNRVYKGLKLNFNPETNELSNTLWLDTGMGEIIEKKINF